MQRIYKNCCGLDVHKKVLVACLKKGNKQEIKEFGAQTKDIKEMANWLLENDCEMIAMESTASYWKPLVNIFEIKDLDFIVINAKDYKNVPGRKTDALDSEWIASLLQHGLLKASFIPKREQRELREATRYRKSLVEERARSLNRLQKMLEGANIKLSSLVSNINGVSSMNLLDYVLNNDEVLDEAILEKLITTKLKATNQEILEAMDGIITDFQKTMMKEVIKHYNELSERIKDMDKIIELNMEEYMSTLTKIIEIPGIGKRSGEIILAEIGLNMEIYPTQNHISSWAGICPGNNESAGKKKSGKTRKGNKILKSTLVQCAQSAVKNKESFYSAQYHKLMVKRGKKRAIVAVAHSMLISIYHMLKNNMDYVDLGSDYYNQFNTDKKVNSYLKKLKELGYEIHTENNNDFPSN